MTEEDAAALIAKAVGNSRWKRGFAAWEIGNLRSLRAAPALVAFLRTPDTDRYGLARLKAVEALGLIRALKAVPLLVQFLGNKDGHLRGTAAQSLVWIGLPAIPSLMEALSDPIIRTAAALALFRIDPAAHHDLVDARSLSDSDRSQDAAALPAEIGPAAIAALIQTFQDRHEVLSMRREAARRLAVLGLAAAPALIAAFRDKSRDWLVCLDAITALGVIGGPQAILALTEALQDKSYSYSVSWEAARALGEIARGRPEPALRAALPALRRAITRDPMSGEASDSIYLEVFEEIEAVTEALKDLPVSAAAPPPDIYALPRPAMPTPET